MEYFDFSLMRMPKRLEFKLVAQRNREEVKKISMLGPKKKSFIKRLVFFQESLINCKWQILSV